MGERTTDGSGRYEAEVRRTTHGVAHVCGGYAGLARLWGQGYAAAVDHGPTILDGVVKVRGRRAATFGLGPDGAHLDSDVAYAVLGLCRCAYVR